MAQAAIAADIHQPLDVELHLAAQIALRAVLAVDNSTNAVDLLFRQIAYPQTAGDVDPCQDLLAGRESDAIDIGQRDLDRLVPWDIHPGDTSHDSSVLLVAACDLCLALPLFVLGILRADYPHDPAPLDDLAVVTAF